MAVTNAGALLFLKILVSQLSKSAMGARPLERAVDEWVVQPLVDAWFANRLKGGPVRFIVAASAQSAAGAPKIVFSQD